jgi:hypothetical protein
MDEKRDFWEPVLGARLGLLSFALYRDADTSNFVVDRKRSLRLRSAGQKSGGSPKGLAPHLPAR